MIKASQTNPYQTRAKFLGKVSKDAQKPDQRENGANSFKQVMNNRKNQVSVEFEELQKLKLGKGIWTA